MLWVLAFALALDLNVLELCSRLGPQKFLNFMIVLCLISWKFLSLGLCKRSRLGPQRLGIMLSVRTSKFLNFMIVLCLILWEFFYCMAFVNALVLDLIGLELCSRLGPHFFELYLRFGPVLSWISDVFSHLFFALF